MSAPAAFRGNYSDLKFIKTRSVAVISIEIEIEAAAAFVAAFGTPLPGAEVPVAIARLDVVDAPSPAPKRNGPKLTAADKRTWADMPMAQQAALRCAEPEFQLFLGESLGHLICGAEACAATVRTLCGVTSRKHIAESPIASAKWVDLDTQYQIWLREPGA